MYLNFKSAKAKGTCKMGRSEKKAYRSRPAGYSFGTKVSGGVFEKKKKKEKEKKQFFFLGLGFFPTFGLPPFIEQFLH
jgi:hypothetical protein